MSKVLNINNNNNNNSELPVATEEECTARRNALIYVGMVRPAENLKLFIKNGDAVALSTKEASARKRKELIGRGVIIPEPVMTIRPKMRTRQVKEEGLYRVKPIRNDGDYERRKDAYFHMMQEMLISRRELDLVFNQWEESKMGSWPSWYY